MIAASAFAQDETARRQAVEIAARVPLEKASTGAPYSADTIVEGVQTLADGNRIVRKTTGRVYRDGEGRTRREEDTLVATRTPTGTANARPRTTIAIVDPVGGYSYTLDAERKIAWRTPIGTSASIMGKIEAASADERAMLEKRAKVAEAVKAIAEAKGADPKALEEQRAVEEQKRAAAVAAGGGARGVGGGGRGGAFGPVGGEIRARGGAPGYPVTLGPLERKSLEGVPVEGRKTTTVIPAGQVGNEQPLTIVSEEWRSTDLNVLVMTRHSDPRTGESTYRLTNIVRAEPDRSLFMVPADYEVRDTAIRRMQQ